MYLIDNNSETTSGFSLGNFFFYFYTETSYEMALGYFRSLSPAERNKLFDVFAFLQKARNQFF